MDRKNQSSSLSKSSFSVSCLIWETVQVGSEMSSSIWDETAGAGNGKVDQISYEFFDVASSLVQSENEDPGVPMLLWHVPAAHIVERWRRDFVKGKIGDFRMSQWASQDGLYWLWDFIESTQCFQSMIEKTTQFSDSASGKAVSTT